MIPRRDAHPCANYEEWSPGLHLACKHCGWTWDAHPENRPPEEQDR